MTAMSWPEIRAWRKSTRAALIAQRVALPSATRETVRRSVTEAVGRCIDPGVDSAEREIVGLYWPIRAEINLLPFARAHVAAGGGAALPEVVQKNAPVEFLAWRPGMKMRLGFWDIPAPEERLVVSPAVLLVPLVGFDREGYRLGYGGGYYDRTLAAMDPRPLAIGVGYAFGELPTIHPQPHDIPMDAIVTETGIAWFDRPGSSRAAGARRRAGVQARD